MILTRFHVLETQDTWLFHHRWGKVPGSLSGHPIEYMTVGGRTTAVIPAVSCSILAFGHVRFFQM